MAVLVRDLAADRAAIERAIAGKTLCSVFQEVVARHRVAQAYRWREPDGWHAATFSEARQRVAEVAMGLRSLGFQPGEFAAIMSRNRPELVFADLGVVHAGGTPVGLYNTLAPEQIEYIVGHCGASVAFVEDEDFLTKFLDLRNHLPNLRRVIVMQPRETVAEDWVLSWTTLLDLGREQLESDRAAFERSWRSVQPEDLATLVYTSGTTGPPKGVMLTHRNALWMAESTRPVLKSYAQQGFRHLSYLPYAHVMERHNLINNLLLEVDWVGTTTFCPEPTQVFAYTPDARPMIFATVPRVWEKLRSGLMAGIAAETDAQKRAAVQAALTLGQDLASRRNRREPVPPELEARVESCRPIFQALLSRLGLDQCRLAASGAAPISLQVVEFFQGLGLDFAEAYGLTECTLAATFSTTDARYGTVGRALPGVELKLADDGEVLVRGGNVMKGYYKDRAMTAETLDGEGWLHTGDVGSFDDDGYLRIIDRKKELLITSGGKNISPANIENFLKSHPLIGQACALGDRRDYITALVVLDAETVPDWASQQGIEMSSLAQLSQHPRVLAEVQRGVEAANQHLARPEQVKKFTLLPTEWTPDSGELTPTLKLRRRVIVDRYASEIDAMYSSKGREGGSS